MLDYKKVSIVIPVFNERATIRIVLDQVRLASTLGLEKEIILVDDHSTDGTTELLKDFNDSSLKIFYHEQNQGKGGALHTGLKQATGDIMVVQDADLEYDPAEIEKVLTPFIQGDAQVVYGSRYLSPSEGLDFWHSFFNQLFTKVGNLLIGQKITDLMTCYKAFNQRALNSVVNNLQSKRFGFEPEITAKITRAGFKITEVPISYHPRSRGEGKHMNFKGQAESLWALIKYSILK